MAPQAHLQTPVAEDADHQRLRAAFARHGQTFDGSLIGGAVWVIDELYARIGELEAEQLRALGMDGVR